MKLYLMFPNPYFGSFARFNEVTRPVSRSGRDRSGGGRFYVDVDRGLGGVERSAITVFT